jgi:hypothetical protein
MPTLILDPGVEQQVKEDRELFGSDRYDEVWEGVYHVTPLPNSEHQILVNRFASIFQEVIGWPERGVVLPGANVSDRQEGWKENYRLPDVAVFLAGGSAKNCGPFWLGGPDFMVEILSPGDQTREKIPFYSKVGVREMLIVERDPWAVDLLRRTKGKLVSVGRSDLKKSIVLKSKVLAFTFRLVTGDPTPKIEVFSTETKRRWLV